MKLQLQFLLLCFLTTFVASQHIQDPEEMDVESPEYCVTNGDGFGGRPLTDEIFSESTFFYEIKMAGAALSEASIDEIIFECEQRIANYLLSETPYFTVCANRRRLQLVNSLNVRRLQADAVAITINPRDQPLEGYECTETEVLEGETCVVVEGAYRVYFEDGAVGSSNTMAYMEGQVAEGMESDSFVGGDILKVTWMDSVEGPTTEDLPSGADSVPVRPANNEVRSGSTPAIVGASVGGILGIGLLAFYRRRSVKATDDDTFTTPAGNNSMG